MKPNCGLELEGFPTYNAPIFTMVGGVMNWSSIGPSGPPVRHYHRDQHMLEDNPIVIHRPILKRFQLAGSTLGEYVKVRWIDGQKHFYLASGWHQPLDRNGETIALVPR